MAVFLGIKECQNEEWVIEWHPRFNYIIKKSKRKSPLARGTFFVLERVDSPSNDWRLNVKLKPLVDWRLFVIKLLFYFKLFEVINQALFLNWSVGVFHRLWRSLRSNKADWSGRICRRCVFCIFVEVIRQNRWNRWNECGAVFCRFWVRNDQNYKGGDDCQSNNAFNSQKIF